jgi:hypothetical protein
LRTVGTCGNAGPVSTIRIRFEGPSLLALQVARELADARGVDLTSSNRPESLGDGRARLELTLEGEDDRLLRAVDKAREDLPDDASLDVLDH